MSEHDRAAAIAERLLGTLFGRGVTLTVNGGDIDYCAPPGTLTPDLLNAMRRHKGALLLLLHKGEIDAIDQEGPALILARVQAAITLWAAYAAGNEPQVASAWREWLTANERFCSWSAALADRSVAQAMDRRAAEAIRAAEAEAKHMGPCHER